MTEKVYRLLFVVILISLTITLRNIELIYIQPIKVTVAVILLFYVPGRALMAASTQDPQKPVSTFLISTGLSIALIILFSLVLGLLIIPINFWSLIIVISTFSIAACIWSFLTNRNDQSNLVFSHFIKRGLRYFAWLLILTIVFTIPLFISINGELRQPQEKFTELWITPSKTIGSGSFITIGIRNYKTKNMQYLLRVSSNSRIMDEWTIPVLSKSYSWEKNYEISSICKESNRIEVNLMLASNPGFPYRHLSYQCDEEK